MAETIGITKAITNLNVAHERLNLSPTNEPFFLQNGVKIYMHSLKKKNSY